MSEQSKTFKDVMIDFETLGTGANKCVCQVGAVYFDNVTGELGAEFKANIDAASHVELGGVLYAPTVYWWLAQSDAARNSILAHPRQSVSVAMTNLNEFLRPAKRIWSHATFDFVTLMDTLHQCKISPSISYKSGMDLRTLVYLSGVTFDVTPREGVHHDGLADAKHQVKWCVKALNLIKMNRQLLKYLTNLEDK